MATSNHPGHILPQDLVPQDGSGEVLTAQPVSQAEIDDLLYGEDRHAGERVERLQEIAAALRSQEPSDFGGNDAGAALAEIDAAIARLSSDGALEGDVETMDDDPQGHRETLAPDSDELDTIMDDDAQSLTDGSEPLADEALDPEEWDDGDDRDPRRGVL